MKTVPTIHSAEASTPFWLVYIVDAFTEEGILLQRALSQNESFWFKRYSQKVFRINRGTLLTELFVPENRRSHLVLSRSF